ncbi:hypothetical protein BH23GEM2_BH23GEM2_18910 [soil metagenome]
MGSPVRRIRPPHAWAVIASGAIVTAAYVSTMARTVTKWDAGEFLGAIHSLGIPHPPGTPLYVLTARGWAMLPLPLSFAARVNLFSAVCGAAAVTVLGLLVRRWSGDSSAGAAATLCAGGTATLWLSATEAEAYAPALLAAVLLLAVPEWVTDRLRRWSLLGFVAGLSWTLHPVALVTLPAALVLALEDPRAQVLAFPGEEPPIAARLRHLLRFCRDRVREGLAARGLAAAVLSALLGLSVVLFLLMRAQHDPAVNQGNPATLNALRDVLAREQYPSHGLWARRAPLWLQLGNWFEYADWQFALGLSPGAPPSWLRTPITLLFAALGSIGLVGHRRMDRRSWRALLVAFLSATIGLVLYLNMLLSPSYGGDLIPSGSAREARERDYFFTAAFVIWGAWAGLGGVLLARRLRRASAAAHRGAPLPAAAWLPLALLVSAAPLALNHHYVREQRLIAAQVTRDEAVGLLASLPEDAVFLALGDNDTYPLWYAQVVEGVRRDVAVVTVPLLAVRWNREEVARRQGFPSVLTAAGTSDAVAAVCSDAAALSRPVFMTPYAPTSRLSALCPRLQAAGMPLNPR